jgi:hypothetical protein
MRTPAVFISATGTRPSVGFRTLHQRLVIVLQRQLKWISMVAINMNGPKDLRLM